jgi:hypothetical protein
MSRVAQWPSHYAPSVGTQLTLCVLIFKSSKFPAPETLEVPMPRWEETNVLLVVCPDGRRPTFCLLFAGRRWCRGLGWHSDHLIVHHQWEFSAHSRSKVPIAPMGALLTCPPIDSHLSIFGSIFGSIREMYVPGTFVRPDGKVADVLASTHACTTANDASVNYSRCVPQ